MRLPIILALTLTFLSAEHREALLIGNSNYQYISNLNDTSSNLSSLKRTLKGLSFNVVIENNLNSKKLKQAIDRFKNRLAGHHDTIGFLYYSGHGCQLDNVGYLVPTNVDTKKKIDIEYDAMNIDKMLKILDSAGNRVNMLFLDACRDVPTNAKGSSKGLGQAPNRPKGTLLVYATEAGEIANDNNNFVNSLISNINKPNKNIRDIAYDISNEVADQTGEGQIPEVFAKRLPKVILKQGYVPPTPKPPITSTWITPTKNRVTWKKAKQICRDNGARLPTREELKKVVRDCGGINATGDDKDWKSITAKNRANKAYQFCYKQKGFTSSYYWSSTTYASDSSYAWYVLFYNGRDDWYGKTDEHRVRCVRGGQ